jgi:uncharacterized protein YukE
MSILTRIEGNPDQVTDAAVWVRNRFQPGLDDALSSMRSAEQRAVGGWNGPAGEAFQARVAAKRKEVSQVSDDSLELATSILTFADSMRQAQRDMDRARSVASSAGLVLTAETIEHPGSGPANPGDLPTGQVTTEQATAHAQAVTAFEEHVRKLEAYDQAAAIADPAREAFDFAAQGAAKFWSETVGKWHINAADFVNAAAGEYVARHRNVLKKQAAWLRDMSKRSDQHYLRSPGGSPQARYNESMRAKYLMEAEVIDRRLASVSKSLLSKTPVIGYGITAAGIGFDISQGKPAGKAVFSGVLGAGGAYLAASLVATGPVGLTAVVAVGGGILAGMAADAVWDHWVPEGAKDAINEGLEDVGDALGDAWDAVF